MTKNDLANKLSVRTGLSHEQSLEAIEALIAIATNTFKEGHNIYLRGFGTMKLVTRKAKLARKISDGTTVMVPTHKTVKFVPSPVVKSILNDL